MSIVQYIVPVFYMLLLAFILTRIQWLQRAGFTKKFVVVFFVAKCLAGFAYNFVALRYIPNRGDIWPFFEDGLYLYHSFLQSPTAFFETWSQGFGFNGVNVLSSDSSLARSAFEIIKTLHFLLNFLTFGSLAGNTVIFNFLAVLCFFKFWKFLKEQLSSQGIVAGLIFFLLPSMFFYSSGILKEGLVIGLLCLLIPLSHKVITSRISFKTTAAWVLAIAILFVLKFFVALLWLFCMAVWWLMIVFLQRQLLVLLVTIAVATGCFFYSHHISPSLNFPGYLVKRQQEFLALPAASALPVKVLTQTPTGFVKAIPTALNNVLFKPLPGEGGKSLYLIFSVEMILFWLGLLFIIAKRKKQILLPQKKSMAIVLLLFALLNLLVIGFIVPNVGAIMRYRSIFFPFLALAVIIITQWQPKTGKIYSRMLKMICKEGLTPNCI
jgi:hypothetical protein